MTNNPQQVHRPRRLRPRDRRARAAGGGAHRFEPRLSPHQAREARPSAEARLSAGGGAPPRAGLRMKILLVTSRYPWPPRRGDQMRALQMLDILAAEHAVTLLAPAPARDQPAPPADAPYRVELYRPGGTAVVAGMARAIVKRLPLQTGLFYQPDLGRKLRELAPAHDLGILQLVRLAIHADDLGGTPFLVDLIDSLALNLSQRAAVDRRWLAPLLQGRSAPARSRRAAAGREVPAPARRLRAGPSGDCEPAAGGPRGADLGGAARRDRASRSSRRSTARSSGARGTRGRSWR